MLKKSLLVSLALLVVVPALAHAEESNSTTSQKLYGRNQLPQLTKERSVELGNRIESINNKYEDKIEARKEALENRRKELTPEQRAKFDQKYSELLAKRKEKIRQVVENRTKHYEVLAGIKLQNYVDRLERLVTLFEEQRSVDLSAVKVLVTSAKSKMVELTALIEATKTQMGTLIEAGSMEELKDGVEALFGPVDAKMIEIRKDLLDASAKLREAIKGSNASGDRSNDND